MRDGIFHFYLDKTEPHKSCLMTLRAIILNSDDHIRETLKYGMPCFCWKDKIICYLWTDRKTGEPYILMAAGKRLDHPCLEMGDRKKMKILRVNPEKDLPVKIIKEILNQALDLHRSATDYG